MIRYNSAKMAEVKQALSQFTRKLYDQISAEQGGNLQNVFFSPVSIYTACLMALAGADGVTKTEMLNALCISKEGTSEALHQTFGSNLMKYFKPTAGVDVSIANRMFLLKEAKIVEAYEQTLAKYYEASAEKLNALNDLESMRQHMNQWVEKQTKDKIKDLLPHGALNNDTTLVLMNALYFKGFWKKEFKERYTDEEVFHCLDGSKMKVPMMDKVEEYPFVELREFDALALKLPFRGANWEMLIVLPNQQAGLPNLVTELKKEGKIAAILNSFFIFKKVRLHLPKFKLDVKDPINLKSHLSACGMKSLFSECADLTKMCTDPRLYIQSAYHKAFLEVDEYGATAAAATGMYLREGAAYSSIPPLEFRVNKPFFVAIVCDETVPVFIGHVVKPELL